MGFKSSPAFSLGVNEAQCEISQEGKSLTRPRLLLCSLRLTSRYLQMTLERTTACGQQMGGWPRLCETAPRKPSCQPHKQRIKTSPCNRSRPVASLVICSSEVSNGNCAFIFLGLPVGCLVPSPFYSARGFLRIFQQSSQQMCSVKGHKSQQAVQCLSWRRKWQPTPVLLPGKFHGQKQPGGLQFMGLQRVRHDLATEHPQSLSQLLIQPLQQEASHNTDQTQMSECGRFTIKLYLQK